MREILGDVETWLAQDRPVAVATVIQTWGSSPRREGAKMAVTPDGGISGSVSGGCVEAAVFEEAVRTLTSKQPRLLHYGVADETAWEVGMACGGSIDIFVNTLDRSVLEVLKSVLAREESAALVTVIRGSEQVLGRQVVVHADGSFFSSVSEALNAPVIALAKECLHQGASRRLRLSDEVEVFIEALLPPPTLIAVGGVHITIALMDLSRILGYRTIVIDPRQAFGNEWRFPHIDRLIQSWPEDAFRQIPITRSTAVAMLTHDPKLDDPALKIALTSPAFYVGALGSRQTQAKRRERLLQEGLTEEQLDRLHGPIGLDLQARTPSEIALSILSEIVAERNKAGV